MKPIKYTYASPKRKRSELLPTISAISVEPIRTSTTNKPEITARKGLKRSLSADSDVVERLLKKRKQEFDTVDQVSLVEEKRHFELEYAKVDLVEENRGPFWNDLPLELFSKVAELLTHSEIVSLATACRSSSQLLQMEELWRRFYFEYNWKLDDHIKEQKELKKNGPPEQDSDQANFWRSKYKQTHVKEWMKERTKTPKMEDFSDQREYKRTVRPSRLTKLCLKCIKKHPEAVKNKIFAHPLNNKILEFLFTTREIITVEDIKGILFSIEKLNFTESIFEPLEVLEELSKRSSFIKKLHLGGVPYDDGNLNALAEVVEKFQTEELQVTVQANSAGEKVLKRLNKRINKLTLGYGPIEGDFMHKLQFYCPNLVKIDFANASITGLQLHPLLDMPSVASIKAYSCTLDDTFVTQLSLKKPFLKELFICWNECSIRVSSFIGFKELTSLALSYTPLVYDVDLAFILENNPNLKHLILTKCGLSEVTCKVLSTLTKLEELIIPETLLFTEYFKHLSKCTSITKLNISDVTLINDDMCHFIPSLPRLSSLEIDSVAFFESPECGVAPSLKTIVTRPKFKYDLPSLLKKCPNLEKIIVEEPDF